MCEKCNELSLILGNILSLAIEGDDSWDVFLEAAQSLIGTPGMVHIVGMGLVDEKYEGEWLGY